MKDQPAKPRGFDFTQRMRRVCADMVARLPELAHIDLSAVAIGFAQARRKGAYGIQATLTPMRFEAGSRTTTHRGKTLTVQRMVNDAGTEMLYLLSFYLPRFLDCPREEKVVTVLHELWHISPQFNGDLRRFGGRCYAHGTSRKRFDTVAEELARRWLGSKPPADVPALLRCNFRQLVSRYGRVYGAKIATPKLIPAPPPKPRIEGERGRSVPVP